MKYLLLALALGISAPALAQNLTIDGQVGGTTYVSEGPKEVQATTRGFEVPEGMTLVMVNHPDEIVCTVRPTPSTWTLKPLYKPKSKPRGLTATQAAKLKELLK